ncbi:MAG: hypothetical protein M2R45_00838 [Verrucomicrobia subdivision 3 bacterium]|nr:hypothetical protein [Limisphaerales bacterium]MCS1413056.1 hypothetical protein [Limisphaerales bacterium]
MANGPVRLRLQSPFRGSNSRNSKEESASQMNTTILQRNKALFAGFIIALAGLIGLPLNSKATSAPIPSVPIPSIPLPKLPNPYWVGVTAAATLAIKLATWGEQKAEVDSWVSIFNYADEESGNYFGIDFGRRAKVTPLKETYETWHEVFDYNGNYLMGYWTDAESTWRPTERYYSFTTGGDGYHYFHYWKTSYWMHHYHSSSGTNPPDPMPYRFSATIRCHKANVKYSEDSGLTITPQDRPKKYKYRLPARRDGYRAVRLLKYGEEMLYTPEAIGSYRLFWNADHFIGIPYKDTEVVTDFPYLP